MRKRLLLSRLAAVLAAAAVIVSGCYHYMPPQSQMDRSVTESSRQVSRADRAGYTVAMVERALQRYGDEGREATVAYYNSPESVDGEWYVFIVDENDLMIAHADPGRLGQDLKGDLGVDVNGYRFGDQILSTTEEGLWTEYVHISPITDQAQAKHTWVVRYDGLIFGSGWYE